MGVQIEYNPLHRLYNVNAQKLCYTPNQSFLQQLLHGSSYIFFNFRVGTYLDADFFLSRQTFYISLMVFEFFDKNWNWPLCPIFSHGGNVGWHTEINFTNFEVDILQIMCAKSESKIPSAVSEKKIVKDKLTGQRTPSDMAIAELTWPNNLFFYLHPLP